MPTSLEKTPGRPKPPAPLEVPFGDWGIAPPEGDWREATGLGALINAGAQRMQYR